MNGTREWKLSRELYCIGSHDYNKAKQDGGVKKIKCINGNDRTYTSVNYTGIV